MQEAGNSAASSTTAPPLVIEEVRELSPDIKAKTGSLGELRSLEGEMGSPSKKGNGLEDELDKVNDAVKATSNPPTIAHHSTAWMAASKPQRACY